MQAEFLPHVMSALATFEMNRVAALANAAKSNHLVVIYYNHRYPVYLPTPT